MTELIAGMMIGLTIGLIVCVIVSLRTAKKTRERVIKYSWGRLRVDYSEPDEPAKLFVELKGVTPEMIAMQKVVTFEVVDESYLSHE